MIFRSNIFITTLIALVLSGCQSAGIQRETAETTADNAPVRLVKRQANGSDKVDVDSVLLRLETTNTNKDLWQLTREHMALPRALDNSKVQARIKWYAKHDHYLNKVAIRASRYYHHIVHSVIDRDMPAEIALLPVIESSYDPFVQSPAKAAGAWQFIPSTGDHFGLKRNWWYDGRKDILESTDAALDYLEYLHGFFDGDWLLALAAYNAGEGTVKRAIKKNIAKGKPTDFWSLDLPKETRAYIPKLLAVAEIFRNPGDHGLSLTPLDNSPHFAVVDTGGQIDLSRAAALAGIDIEELRQLNPGFSRWATDPEGPHRLLVPINKSQAFAQRIAKLDDTNRISWARYEVKPGDTLGFIANRFNTSVRSVKSTNKLNTNLIRVGQSLLIPAALVESTQYAISSNATTQNRLNQAAPEGKAKQFHKVQSGDSLWKIAQLHGVNPRDIARWNDISLNDTLSLGQQLIVYTDKGVPSDLPQTAHVVAPGDNLSLIAQLYNISIIDLIELNELEPDALLKPGQQIQITPPPSQS